MVTSAAHRVSELLEQAYQGAQHLMEEECSRAHFEPKFKLLRAAARKVLGSLGYRLAKKTKYIPVNVEERLWAVQNLEFAIKHPGIVEDARACFEDQRSLHIFDMFLLRRFTIALTPDGLAPTDVDQPEEAELVIIPHVLRNCDGVVRQVYVRRSYIYDDFAEPCEGDYCIDAGAYRGETAIWMSQLVGPSGMVYAFEPIRKNFQIMLLNLADVFHRNIRAYNMALWSEYMMLHMAGETGSAYVTSNPLYSSSITPAVSIDEAVEGKYFPGRIQRIDYIKSDAEGSETKIIEGARKSLRKFRPKLALAVYHKNDIFELPLMIKEINPDYEFRLKHSGDTTCELVLFARAT